MNDYVWIVVDDNDGIVKVFADQHDAEQYEKDMWLSAQLRLYSFPHEVN